ncbi:HAD-IIIC family phosphatase [Clostridium felsineum]|uniref:HAD-IIIC family phosphatase n=1 Tax=Clostridium felsineum TaxID=36839 RepID=UPI0009C7FDBD|nr:HAD-IIIC family phosphatase [Clostridium felsineum]URZ18154.1 hypothetical protein CLFE_042090 [Clostridium felsineum DSM 794]
MEYFDYLPLLDESEKKRLYDSNVSDYDKLKNLIKLSKYKLTLLESVKLGKQVEKLSYLIGKCNEYRKINIGIMGNYTLNHLKYNLIASAFRRGILLNIQFAPFDSIYPIALGEIHPFKGKMDFLFMYMSPKKFYSTNMTISNVKSEMISLIEKIKKIYSTTIILTNSNKRFYESTSNINILNKNDFEDLVESYNNICEEIIKNDKATLMLNIDKISSIVGLQKWIKPIDYYRSKIPFAYENSDIFSDYFTRLICAYLGIRKKVIVLDLDGVLWGGILGDDKIDNIIIGNGTSEGEAFKVFQEYLVKEMYETGVVLTVVSKNNLENVLDVLENCSEMILNKEHFAMLQVNWKDKVSNIRAIADTLNVRLDSIVFIDDNIHERNLVREKLPQVTTPEIGNNPSNYPIILSNSGYFDYYNLTKEDLNRTNSYINRIKSIEIQNNFSDYASYLKSTNMKLIIQPFQDNDLNRVVQLINKTNQFNLMCTRVKHFDIEKVTKSSNQFGIQISLGDKYENYGIISVVILNIDQNILSIDTWVMSCRVFNKNIENAVLNYLCQLAKEKGIRKIIGKCKNIKEKSYVDELYLKMGFEYLRTQDEVAIYEISKENFKKHECDISEIVIKDFLNV